MLGGTWRSSSAPFTASGWRERHRRSHDVKGLPKDEATHVSLSAAAAETVAVQAGTHEEVHAVPGPHDQGEASHRQHGQAEIRHPAGEAGVQNHRINDERNQRPDFLGVPAPEAAPGIVGPNGARHCAYGQEDETDLHAAVGEAAQGLDGGEVSRADQIVAKSDVADSQGQPKAA